MRWRANRELRHALPERASREASPNAAAREPGRGFARAFLALRHRNYRLYWLGQLVSVMGTNMQTIGQAWLVLELTNSAWQLGLVGAVQFLPVLLFSMLGGVFADRWPKRRVLLITQTAAMIQALALFALVATGAIQLWHIYALALLLGLTTSLDQPTRSAFVVELVGREDLPNAIALNSSLTNLARVVGPGLGGLLIAATGVTVLFLLNALSFLAVLLGLALIRPGELHAQSSASANGPARRNTWHSLVEGLDYVRTTPSLLLIILVVGLVLLFGANYNVVLPLFATDVLHAGATGFGFLSAALGIGALVAALWLAARNQKPTIRGVLIGTFLFTLIEAAFAVSHVFLLSLVLLASLGAAESVFGALAITALQTIAPNHLRGRVNSVYILFFTGSIPLGYVLAGWLSGLLGASVGLLICMALSLVVVVAGWMWRKPAERALQAIPS